MENWIKQESKFLYKFVQNSAEKLTQNTLFQLPFIGNFRNQTECWGGRICADESLICDKIGGLLLFVEKNRERRRNGREEK